MTDDMILTWFWNVGGRTLSGLLLQALPSVLSSPAPLFRFSLRAPLPLPFALAMKAKYYHVNEIFIFLRFSNSKLTVFQKGPTLAVILS